MISPQGYSIRKWLPEGETDQQKGGFPNLWNCLKWWQELKGCSIWGPSSLLGWATLWCSCCWVITVLWVNFTYTPVTNLVNSVVHQASLGASASLICRVSRLMSYLLGKSLTPQAPCIQKRLKRFLRKGYYKKERMWPGTTFLIQDGMFPLCH